MVVEISKLFQIIGGNEKLDAEKTRWAMCI
jgi:hypothetical protein